MASIRHVLDSMEMTSGGGKALFAVLKHQLGMCRAAVWECTSYSRVLWACEYAGGDMLLRESDQYYDCCNVRAMNKH